MADVTDLVDLVRRRAYTIASRASIEAGRETVQEANKDTGYMATTTFVTPVISGGSTFSAEIVIPAEYAEFVIYGTRPHVIRATNAKVLAWDGPRGPAFATTVFHPGYEGNDFFFKPMPERWSRKLREAIRTTS